MTENKNNEIDENNKKIDNKIDNSLKRIEKKKQKYDNFLMCFILFEMLKNNNRCPKNFRFF